MISVALLALLACVAASPCNNVTYYSSLDFNGGDLPGQPVSKSTTNEEECSALCCATPGCTAFSLNAGSPGSRWCYLKSGGWSTAPISGVISGCLSPENPLCPAPPPPPPYFPWFNLSLARETRLNTLVAAMTLDEQILWLNDAVPSIPRLGLPAYSWEAESLHGVSWNGVATVFPENIAWGATFDVALISEVADCIAVEARAKFIDGMAPDGSTREFGGLSFMTPNNNLFLDPRWGRGQETYGEDPTLTSAITFALVQNLQFGADPNYTRTIATTKHFLGYHLESFNGDGQYRLSHSYNYTETDIQQYYLKPFAAAVRANVTACMCAYDGSNTTNPEWPNPTGPEPWGVPMCLSTELNRLLRGQLSFGGYVISDEGAITFAGPGYHDFTPTVLEAACLAINAGTDLALGGEYLSTLSKCVANGNVSVARVSEAVARVLRAQFDLGWFDTVAARQQGLPDPVAVYNNVSVAANVSSPAHRALSQTVASKSFVLLKNHNNVLPLQQTKLKRVALVGPNANYDLSSTSSYIGNYPGCVDGPGSNADPDPRCHVVTLLEALSNLATTAGFLLAYEPGSDVNTVNNSGIPAAVQSAQNADVIVAAVGLNTCQESFCSEGEANDRAVPGGRIPEAGLDFPGSQLALLQALKVAYPSTPLVLVIFSGGPVSSPWAVERADAILQVWYPGYEGGQAIVDALFGNVSPAGRLPVTIVANTSELPAYTDTNLATYPGRTHLYYTGKPLFPFGFGLSYATFQYTQLVVTPPQLAPATEAFSVSMVLSHTSGQASDEVVQVYGAFQAASVGVMSVPRQQLLGFVRLYNLQPGSVTPVTISISRDMLQLMDAAGNMAVQTGVWKLYVGGGPPSNQIYGGGAVLQGSLGVL